MCNIPGTNPIFTHIDVSADERFRYYKQKTEEGRGTCGQSTGTLGYMEATCCSPACVVHWHSTWKRTVDPSMKTASDTDDDTDGVNQTGRRLDRVLTIGQRGNRVLPRPKRDKIWRLKTIEPLGTKKYDDYTNEWTSCIIEIEVLLTKFISKGTEMVFRTPGGGRKWPKEKIIRWTLQHRPNINQLREWTKVDCCGGTRRYNVQDWAVIAGVFYGITEQMDGDEEMAAMTIANREKWQAKWIRAMVGIVYAIATNSHFMLANSNEQASFNCRIEHHGKPRICRDSPISARDERSMSSNMEADARRGDMFQQSGSK